MAYDDCLGLPEVTELWYCITYRDLFHEPSERFTAAVAEDKNWTTYRLTVTEEHPRRKCFCMWQLKTFVRVLGDLDGRVCGLGEWRKMAMHLFHQHLVGEKKARRV